VTFEQVRDACNAILGRQNGANASDENLSDQVRKIETL